jgi:DNA-binding XRE family transcriptional regulator
MADIHSTGGNRPAEVRYPDFDETTAAAGVREPAPPPYGRSASATARQLGRKVRLLRVARGWSQETLAELAGLDRTAVGTIERAERNVTLATVEKLARAFELSVAELLDNDIRLP